MTNYNNNETLKIKRKNVHDEFDRNLCLKHALK